MKYQLLLLLLSLLLSAGLLAQPSICGPGAQMAPNCFGACVICDIDGFSGNNEGNQGGQAPPGYCTFAIHHMEWIGFVAGSTSISLEIAVSNCNNGGGNGLEAGIYEGVNCQNFNLISNCETAILNNTSVVLTTTSPLVIGQYYWLVMDSNGGNACDFSVSVVGGSTNVPPLSPIPAIYGPTMTCPGGTLPFSIDPVNGASSVNWTVGGAPAGIGDNVNILFPNAGSVQVCVEASNVCHPPVSLCTTVEVAPIPATEVFETICMGDCFIAPSGDAFCTAGIFPVIYSSYQGCDSIVNYNVDMIPEPIVSVEATICEGGSYTVGNEVFTQTGVYVVELAGVQNCDSTVVLTLFIELNQETNLVEEICEGEVYLLGTETYSETGVYSQVYTSATGCDSILHLDLTVHPADSVYLTESICEGDSVSIGTESFHVTGNYEVTLENTPGCDSVVFLDLTVTPLPATNLTEHICDGDSVSVGTEHFFTTGTYQVVLPSVLGCDSTINLDLTVLPTLETQLPVQICEGQTYTVGNESFSATGQYEIALTAASGCDSIVHLHLAVLTVLETFLVENICQGQTFSVGSESFSSSGAYEVNLISATGCDSIVYLDLTVNPQPETQLQVAICDSESYQVGNEIFDQPGQYEVVLSTPAGCDSTVFLDLSVLPSPVVSLSEEICAGESYSVGNEVFTQSGQYAITVPAVNGCDSTIQLDLEVLAVVQTDLTVQICEGESFIVGTENFTQTGLYDIMLTAASGCDSVVHLNLEALNFLQTDLSEQICSGESLVVGNEVFDQTGQFQILLTAASGCDSIVHLDLLVVEAIETPLAVEVCHGETYQAGNEVFDQTGFYQLLLTAASGCDSMVQLDLTVFPPIVENLQVSICQGTSYTVGSESFSQTGQYQIDFVSAAGCDSTVLLDLEVSSFLQTDIDQRICEGEQIQIGNQVFTQSGQYQVNFVTATGCDSIVFLSLEVLPHWQTSLTASICENENYLFGNQAINQPGTYQLDLMSGAGCDSIVVLDLEVMPVVMQPVAAEICDGQTYGVGTEVFTQAGQYEITLTAISGCDSIVQLDLSVLNCNVVVGLVPDDPDCYESQDGAVTMTLLNGEAPVFYEWVNLNVPSQTGSGFINDPGQQEVVNGLSAGEHQFVFTDANGFSFQEIIELKEPPQLTGAINVSQFGNFNLPCYGENRGTMEASASGGTTPYLFSWSNGTQQPMLQNLPAGPYGLTITDSHGCAVILQETLTEPAPLQWSVSVRQPGCEVTLGELELVGMQGGAGPYQYFLNGVPGTANPLFSELMPGSYELVVTDANGCEIDTTIYLQPPPTVIVSLGDDQEIDLGGDILLRPIIIPPSANVFVWEGEGLSCNDCREPVAAPLSTTTYRLTAFTDDGCQAEDQITVFVKKDRQVFVPDAFSPNDDRVNDVLMIFSGPEVAKVRSMLVFSRWGETVFQYYNFPPNDPTYGWEGRHRGEIMQPGVYTWMAEVEFIDGVVRLYKGGVNLIR